MNGLQCLVVSATRWSSRPVHGLCDQRSGVPLDNGPSRNHQPTPTWSAQITVANRWAWRCDWAAQTLIRRRAWPAHQACCLTRSQTDTLADRNAPVWFRIDLPGRPSLNLILHATPICYLKACYLRTWRVIAAISRCGEMGVRFRRYV